MMDSGTANGSDSQELTRVQNYDAGSNENTNVTQAAPTSRAAQKTAGAVNAAETTSSSGGGGNARTAAAGNGAPPPWWAVPGYSPGDRIGQGAYVTTRRRQPPRARSARGAFESWDRIPILSMKTD